MKRLSLARPHAIVSVPRTLQAGLLLFGLFTMAGCFLGLVPWLTAGTTFGPWQAAQASVGGVLLFLLARPAAWRPWVRAAADPYGVYLRSRGRWHCVRWRHVHAIDATSHGLGDNRLQTKQGGPLVVRALVSEAERKALAPGSWVHHGSGGDPRALRLEVPGTGRDPDGYKRAFEQVRRAA